MLFCMFRAAWAQDVAPPPIGDIDPWAWISWALLTLTGSGWAIREGHRHMTRTEPAPPPPELESRIGRLEALLAELLVALEAAAPPRDDRGVLIQVRILEQGERLELAIDEQTTRQAAQIDAVRELGSAIRAVHRASTGTP